MEISFAWTTPALLTGRKTCTRRDWTHFWFNKWVAAWRRGDVVHTALDKSRRAGGSPIGQITLTCEPYMERLGDMPESDLEAEGGLWDSLDEFVDLQGGDADKELAILRFTFEPLPPVVEGRQGSLFEVEVDDRHTD